MKAFAGVLGVLIFLCVSTLSGDTVFASEGGDRWFTGTAAVLNSTPVPPNDQLFCPTYYHDVSVGNESTKKTACMYEGVSMRLATYLMGGQRSSAVAFGYDTYMHTLRGLCEVQSCQYSAEKDLLVTQRQFSSYGRNIAIYTHISQRIQRVVNVGSGTIEYVFNGSSPDYELKNDTGQYIGTDAYVLSANGAWLAVELRDRGTALIDTDTFAARQVIVNGFRYGMGMDPSEEMAVSNDGLNIIVAGTNDGFTMIAVTSNCGQALVGNLALLPGTKECASSDIGVGALFTGFYSGTQPAFHSSGRAFSMTVLTRGQLNNRVTLGVAGSEAPTAIRLLSLGDSFVSGEGENDESFYAAHTNTGLDTCHVSGRSYPFLLARAMSLDRPEVQSVACSGARIGDILQSAENYRGQGDRLGHADISQQEIERTQQSAVETFWPGRAMQASFIDAYTPQVVTVGIGGNDVGLMGKLRVCAMPGVCEWASGNGLQETAGEIKGLFDHLTVLYDKLAALSPTTRIYAIGYSDIITPNGVCDPITALLFSREERVYMQESTRYLNEVIAAAAMKSGIGYIDIQEAFDGHKLCDSFTSSAMNGFVLGDDVPLIASLPLLKLVGAGSFHPKPAGHQMIADDITRAHPPLNFYSWCPNQAVRCPHDVLPPEASTYWQVVADKSAPRATIGSFATEIPHASQRLHISLPASSSLPNSEVKIELRSDSIALGSLRSDSRGGVDGEVVVPLSVPIGYHTLHLLGSSFDGSAIDVYQFLTIGADAELLPALSGDSIVPTEPNQTSSDDGAEQLTGGISALEIQGGATGDTAVLGAHVVQKPIIGTGLSFMTTPIKGQYHTIARYLHRHGWIFMCVAGIVLAVCVIIVFLIRSRWSKRGGSV